MQRVQKNFVIDMKHACNIITALIMTLMPMGAAATEKEVYISYGNMDRWTIRKSMNPES